MFFESITNPKDFYIDGLNEAIGVGAKDDTSDPVVTDDPTRPSNARDEEITKSNTVVINRYKPAEKRFNEAGEPIYEAASVDGIVGEALYEHMDVTDVHTVDVMCAMNESEQNTLLVNLTNKLYSMIVSKVDSIDYGEIPNTRGDVKKLSKYDDLVKCHEILREIFEQYHEKDTSCIDVVQGALDNLEGMKDIFVGAYLAKSSFPISVYETTTLAVINATSFLIACCIEYIKNPKAEGLTVVLNKTGLAKAKDHLLFESLKHFNEACRKGDVENALRPFVKNRVKGFALTLGLGFKAALVLGAVIVAILPIIKDLVYFYYSAKARVSEYFDLQAKFIEMNVNELKSNPDIKTEEDKKAVIRKQLAVAQVFHNIANSLVVDAKTSEVKANKEIKQDSQKYKIDDVDNSAPADGSLF